ncbi:uncharacterized protein BJ171DRAFT_498745 [Polychytrium aggregatum]|uniref:uncharacterized protein n=1 Tax=Polychytrium aggregatum TaxID=110093 RepID=UPI0022FDF4DB|nr:uncharacterized protein BJ171DRAFT_498745 [Polychytrium aggregatum]KAI9206110.1 hypothetical protein BJ171DRAFT_498745 [Polychytrium aggregatum]
MHDHAPRLDGPQLHVDPQQFFHVANMFGSIRSRIHHEEHPEQQAILDNLITQLLDEANSSGKGKPPASARFIETLASVKSSDLPKDASCSVCVEPFNDTETTNRLPCRHHFHNGCIVPWLQLHNTCPICRREFPTDDEEYERKKREAEHARLVAEAQQEQLDSMYG